MDAIELYDALCEPFPIEGVSWRVGSTNGEKTKGMALCYIDARDVMDRLDSVCGPSGWQDNYTAGMQGSIVCNIGIKIGGEWVWKADGAGNTDFEADKGALSDAFKRAAVRWGIGRYLYGMDAPWMPIEQRGKSFIFPDESIGKLNHFYEVNAPRSQWGVRGGIQAYRLLVAGMKTFISQPSDADQFREDNKGLIAGLPVAMRKHFIEQLDRVGATIKEAAE
jgi:hypothetical protein